MKSNFSNATHLTEAPGCGERQVNDEDVVSEDLQRISTKIAEPWQIQIARQCSQNIKSQDQLSTDIQQPENTYCRFLKVRQNRGWQRKNLMTE